MLRRVRVRRRDLEQQFLLLAARRELEGRVAGCALHPAGQFQLHVAFGGLVGLDLHVNGAFLGSGNMRTLSVMFTATGGTTVSGRVISPCTRSM